MSIILDVGARQVFGKSGFDSAQYEYRPGTYGGEDVDDDERATWNSWKEDIYGPPAYYRSETYQEGRESTRGQDIRNEYAAKVSKFHDRMSCLIGELGEEDASRFENDRIDKQGFMLALCALEADKIEEKAGVFHIHFDNDVFVVTTYHMQTFFYFYDAGERAGIYRKVLEALYQNLHFDYEFRTMLHVNRGDQPPMRFDNGQAKIFLSSLRVFDKLEPGPINILVIGSASHPVKSGYTYTALASFLSYSGFSGVIHLFDPFEKHKDVFQDAFEMRYFNTAYHYGTAYRGFDKSVHPHVILDDAYADGKMTNDLDPSFSLIRCHPLARVSTKYVAGMAKVPEDKHSRIVYQIVNQHFYCGGEMRINYRCPNWRFVRFEAGKVPLLHCCETCWYYASLITRIGVPKENVSDYWTLLWSITGEYCKPIAGIRNIHLISMLRHELLRGRTRNEAIDSVIAEAPKKMVIREQALIRLCDLQANFEDVFKSSETFYSPNFDLSMDVRDDVTANQIYDCLAFENVNFVITCTKDYNQVKYNKLLELWNGVDHSGPVVEVLLSRTFGIHRVPVMFVDQLLPDMSPFKVVYQVGSYGLIFDPTLVKRGVRILFDRGKDYF